MDSSDDDMLSPVSVSAFVLLQHMNILSKNFTCVWN